MPPTPRPLVRAVAALLASVLAGAVLAVGLAAPAQAAAYRYWGFFTLSGDTWQFSQKGAAQTTPADGDVEGWRFALGTADQTRTPRGTVSFERVCGQTPAAQGRKRVAVVVDFGRAVDYAGQDAPPKPFAECASVPTGATAADVLAATQEVRVEKGLVCGVDDLPQTGCGDEVADADVPSAALEPDDDVAIALPERGTGDESDAGGGPGTATWIGIGVVVVAAVGVGGLALRRRAGG